MSNAYSASSPVPMGALPTTNGIVQKFLVSTTNLADATFAPDGLTAAPIFGLGAQLLQGNEIIAGSIATLVSYIGPLLNSGALCWVLLDCEGGAQQVAPATQSQHAMQLGQATGRLLLTTVFTSSGTWTAGPGSTRVEVEVVGGGGGGGGVQATAGTEYSTSAGGGGGGYARKFIVNAASPQTVTVGAGGTSTAAVGGTAGGTTSFGSLVSATGGEPGQVGFASMSVKVAYGGNGGMGTNGDINVPGGAAQLAFQYITNDLPVTVPTIGGNSMYGAGSIVDGGVPYVARGYGAGGGGAWNSVSKPAQAGGAGTAGIVIVKEYS